MTALKIIGVAASMLVLTISIILAAVSVVSAVTTWVMPASVYADTLIEHLGEFGEGVVFGVALYYALSRLKRGK